MRMKRKTIIEERYYGIKRRQMSFISMVQQRAAKLETSWAPYFPNDLIFKIFLQLPIRSLLRFSCVCKAWYKLIRCEEFVEAYNSQVGSTPILIRRHDKEKPNTFHVETHLSQSENLCLFPCSSSRSPSKFIHFLEIQEEKAKITDPNLSCSGSILASCNGLILIKSMCVEYERNHFERRNPLENPVIRSQRKPGQLIVMNPVTRKAIEFPLGTLPYGHSANDNYGLVFSHSKGVYKVVHLFKDKSQYVSCEILSLQTRSWRAIDGPSGEVLGNIRNVPVSAIGALHWLPDSYGVDHIVSMDADNERFSVTDLPEILGNHDRLLEMGGYLSFVRSLNKDHLDVWILKGLQEGEWVKQHTIRLDAMGIVDNVQFSVPVFALSAKEMVFMRKEGLYSYDFELDMIREIEIEGGKVKPYEPIMPHSNNLATWEPLEPMS